jgi:diguanylate cyclase (GGDEF)-like protein
MVAILFVDLDRFKLVNDTYGHRVGDWLLQSVANRLRELLREGDTVSRVGGDEFVLVLPDISKLEDATEIAQKLLDSLARTYHIDGKDLHVTPSIGISMFPTDGNEVGNLISRADTAMYHAKEMGRKNFQVFDANTL